MHSVINWLGLHRGRRMCKSRGEEDLFQSISGFQRGRLAWESPCPSFAPRTHLLPPLAWCLPSQSALSAVSLIKLKGSRVGELALRYVQRPRGCRPGSLLPLSSPSWIFWAPWKPGAFTSATSACWTWGGWPSFSQLLRGSDLCFFRARPRSHPTDSHPGLGASAELSRGENKQPLRTLPTLHCCDPVMLWHPILKKMLGKSRNPV